MKSVFRLSRIASLAAVACAVMLAVLTLECAFNSTAVRADDKKEAASAPDETDPDYVVPDGTPDEIMEFLDKLKNRKTKFANRREAIDHAIRMFRARIDAGEKILAQETEPKVAVNAARMKLNALMTLAANDIGDSVKEAMAAITKLKSDKREEVAKAAAEFWMPLRIMTIGTLDDDGRKELTSEVLAAVAESKFSEDAVGAASQLGEALAEKGHVDEGGDLFDQLAGMAKESEEPGIQANAKRFLGIARRMRLPGRFMELEGKRLNGEDFDWSAYRGKVVLVDFWATWCGPCVAELPNVLRNYEKYHDKGFDVVGISLDRSRSALDKFIENKEIPWAQLYEEKLQKGRGWNHPMAEFFGINAIPAAFLVDKEGKVVSSQARGPELSKLLEKLLGDAESGEKAQ